MTRIFIAQFQTPANKWQAILYILGIDVQTQGDAKIKREMERSNSARKHWYTDKTRWPYASVAKTLEFSC